MVFDVGAKDTPYPHLKPKATYHLFEPNPSYFAELPAGPNIYANNYGLGDTENSLPYSYDAESFLFGYLDPPLITIKTLDWYIEENNITRIDFLKIDTEGYDYRVLLGGSKAIDLARYIQYEYWDNKQEFENRLCGLFELKYIGDRNVFCTKI